MGVTAIAAVVGIGANVAVGIAIETIAAVAITATVVGMVTKSPVLMKIGAGLGLASAGAGLIDAGTSATAETAAAGAASESGAAGAAEAAAPAAAAGAGAGIETVNVTAPALTGAANTGNVVANTASLAATGANVANAQSSNTVNARIGDNTTTDVGFQAPTIDAPKTPVMPEIKDPTSWFDTALTGIENHKALATSSAQLLGGAMGGLGTTYAADKQYDINSQLLELQKKKLANGSAQPSINPQYNGTANLYPTTTPVYSGTQAAGIINQQRKPA